MARKRTGWKLLRRNRMVLFFVLGILISAGFVLVDQEMKLQELKYEATQLEETKALKAKGVEQLRKDVESLDTDAAKEALARQKLNMIKKDEILYIVEPVEDGN